MVGFVIYCVHVKVDIKIPFIVNGEIFVNEFNLLLVVVLPKT